MTASFRARLSEPDLMRGTFVKLPAVQSVEILGSVGFDFIIIDAEHAPLDRRDVDLAIMAARLGAMASIVRVPDASGILSALDSGADGVMVPHVVNESDAQRAVHLARYRGGGRGFAPTGRAGKYGAKAMWDHVDAQDAGVAVIAMIEDPPAIDAAAAIAGTAGIDGVFVGRSDLAVSLGAHGDGAPQVLDATRHVCAAARDAGKALWLLAGTDVECATFRDMGATALVLQSDQTFLRKGALAALSSIEGLR